MRIIKRDAVQVHPFPKTMVAPKGPFPRELFDEPDIIVDYETPDDEGGLAFPLGATVQNNYKPLRYLRCSVCLARVLETETEDHVCED